MFETTCFTRVMPPVSVCLYFNKLCCQNQSSPNFQRAYKKCNRRANLKKIYFIKIFPTNLFCTVFYKSLQAHFWITVPLESNITPGLERIIVFKVVASQNKNSILSSYFCVISCTFSTEAADSP